MPGVILGTRDTSADKTQTVCPGELYADDGTDLSSQQPCMKMPDSHAFASVVIF